MANNPDPINGSCVLGIDAAWTTHTPSGVALVQRTTAGWSCLAIAPSYDSHMAQASGPGGDPQKKATGSTPDPAALFEASKQFAGAEVSCVSVDMPLATTPITSRRAADTAISSRFGPKGCAVHSPSAERPGTIADQLRADFAALGYPLHTSCSDQADPALIERYPHVALLALLHRNYRVPYKVSRSGQYWKAEQLSRAPSGSNACSLNSGKSKPALRPTSAASRSSSPSLPRWQHWLRSSRWKTCSMA